MKKLHIDIETFSPVDLAKCGVYKYAEHALAAILLFAYSIDGGPVIVIDLMQGEKIPEEVLAALADDSVEKWHSMPLSRGCSSPTGSDGTIRNTSEVTVLTETQSAATLTRHRGDVP